MKKPQIWKIIALFLLVTFFSGSAGNTTSRLPNPTNIELQKRLGAKVLQSNTRLAPAQPTLSSRQYVPPFYWIAPFILLLLAIAILPLSHAHIWDLNRNKAIVALLLSLPVLILYLTKHPLAVIHSLEEYFSFIVLLWALYTISGGIVLKGDILATPRNNTIFLAIGAVLANLLGTTGASMLLIRPLLTINQDRKRKKHIFIFLIFIVANIGGSLTPLGDPPLFLGFLRGVPFTWTLKLWYIWLMEVVILLGVFYFWDRAEYKKEDPASFALDKAHYAPIQMAGSLNFLFILGVLLTTIFSAQIKTGLVDRFNLPSFGEGSPYREGILILLGVFSLIFTRRAYRKFNEFSFAAIIEVAVLFLGIFMTMIPALELLRIHGPALGITKPYQYFWMTGGLSSFLDNAPTYLVFVTLGQSSVGVDSLQILSSHPLGLPILKAISIGAVFMGANTYIGNAPNFMIKVITETAGNKRVAMPSFFGYMKYSVAILIPTFILITLLFFR